MTMKIKNFLFKIVLVIFLTLAFSKGTYASSDISLNQKEIDAIVSELEKAPKPVLGYHFEYGSHNISFDKTKDQYAIVYISNDNASGFVGVIDTKARSVTIPFKYKDIYFLPENKLLLAEKDKSDTDQKYYISDMSGNLTPAHFDGMVSGVDEAGYITLSRYLKVNAKNEQNVLNEKSEAIKETLVPKLALLDDKQNMVLDFIIDEVWPAGIVFEDDYAIVKSKANEWYAGSQSTTNNAKSGVIDRRGRVLIAFEYDRIEYLGKGKFEAYKNNKKYSIDLNNSKEQKAWQKPSAWAEKEITRAIDEGIVPAILQNNYMDDITRGEFCSIAVNLYESMTKKEISGRVKFYDNVLLSVEKLAYEGIVHGLGNNKFNPNGKIKREEAAVILSKLSEKLGMNSASGDISFTDSQSISTWAIDDVKKVYTKGIMQGVSERRFSPKSHYTKEQAIATLIRLKDK